MCIYYSYSVTYIEDSAPVLLLNITDFSITDDDNIFLLQSTLTVNTTGIYNNREYCLCIFRL